MKNVVVISWLLKTGEKVSNLANAVYSRTTTTQKKCNQRSNRILHVQTNKPDSRVSSSYSQLQPKGSGSR